MGEKEQHMQRHGGLPELQRVKPAGWWKAFLVTLGGIGGSSAGFAVEKKLAFICCLTSPWQQDRGGTIIGRREAGGRRLQLSPNSKAQKPSTPMGNSLGSRRTQCLLCVTPFFLSSPSYWVHFAIATSRLSRSHLTGKPNYPEPSC